jgi:hypothetical protein
MGNAMYPDIIQGSLIVDTRVLALVVQSSIATSRVHASEGAKLRQDVLSRRGHLWPPGAWSSRLRVSF